MSKPFLLDTSVLLNLVRGGELGKYINHTFKLVEATHRHLISIVSHGEIWVIARRNNWATEKQTTLQNILNNVVTVDLNHDSIIEAYVVMDQASKVVAGGREKSW